MSAAAYGVHGLLSIRIYYCILSEPNSEWGKLKCVVLLSKIYFHSIYMYVQYSSFVWYRTTHAAMPHPHVQKISLHS